MIGEFKQRRFLSDERQPEVDFFALLGRAFEQILGQIV